MDILDMIFYESVTRPWPRACGAFVSTPEVLGSDFCKVCGQDEHDHPEVQAH